MGMDAGGCGSLANMTEREMFLSGMQRLHLLAIELSEMLVLLRKAFHPAHPLVDTRLARQTCTFSDETDTI